LPRRGDFDLGAAGEKELPAAEHVEATPGIGEGFTGFDQLDSRLRGRGGEASALAVESLKSIHERRKVRPRPAHCPRGVANRFLDRGETRDVAQRNPLLDDEVAADDREELPLDLVLDTVTLDSDAARARSALAGCVAGVYVVAGAAAARFPDKVSAAPRARDHPRENETLSFSAPSEWPRLGRVSASSRSAHGAARRPRREGLPPKRQQGGRYHRE
jgi:hypothetical protein